MEKVKERYVSSIRFEILHKENVVRCFDFFFLLSNAFPILLPGLFTFMKPRESSRVPSGIKDHTLNWAGFEFFSRRREGITCSGQRVA